jgi:outer membrane protein TolC
MTKVKNSRGAWILSLLLLFQFAIIQSASAQIPDTAQVKRHELSIQQAVDYAAKNNVQVKNALVDVLLQKETNRQITSAAYPSITGSGSLTNNLELQTTLLPGELVGQPGTFVPVTFGTKYITNGGIDLNQILFDGQVFVGLQARKTSIDWANKNVEVTQEMIKTNIHKVYYQLVVGRTQIQLLDANIALLQKQERDAQVMYENGFADKLSVNRATVGIANLQTQREKALTGIVNGYYGLKILMGMPMRDELILTDTLSDTQIREGVLENTVYDYKDRKDFQYLDLTRKLNEFNIRRYKLSKIPTLSLGASYSKQYLSNQFKYNDQWFTASYVALRISVPIFKGFETNSKIQAARLTVQKLDNQLEGLKLTIDSEVQIAKNNFRTAIAAMDFQKKNMELAETVYQQTKKKYESGTASSTDITAAQKDLQEAQTNYITALYDAVVAKTDYLRAIGKL